MKIIKKTWFPGLFLLIGAAVFGQAPGPRRAIVGVLPFETGEGTAAEEAAVLTDQLINELRSWDAFTVLTKEAGSEYLVQGRLEYEGGRYILTAEVMETRTKRLLNTAREEGFAVTTLSARVFPFASQVTENVPFPNYLLGTWQAEIETSEGALVCVMEFRSDRTLRIERFDTWEHRAGNSLRYQGFGTGTYSFWGYVRRMVRNFPSDGFVTLNLRLDDALPRYERLSYTRVNFTFNEDKSVFELATGLGCGENLSGVSIYPDRNPVYTKFTKIK